MARYHVDNRMTNAQQALTTTEAGHALDGAEAVIKRRRPVGFPATHPLALRRAAYVSALVHAMSSGRFDDLRREQELIDPDRALWRQYAPDEPIANPRQRVEIDRLPLPF